MNEPKFSYNFDGVYRGLHAGLRLSNKEIADELNRLTDEVEELKVEQKDAKGAKAEGGA